MVTQMEIRARRETRDEGDDPMAIHCITFRPLMALPIAYVVTLATTTLLSDKFTFR